jgi:O-acetylhomoserine (thiol)-lyase
MKRKTDYRFDTRVIHAAQSSEDWHGATLPPIFQTASHHHPTAENLSQTFSGMTTDHIYMRLTNPTNRILEEKLTALEGGQGAVAMSSGMAAITNTCLALLRTGDEFVTGNSLFVSTYNLFTNIFKKYGIAARLVESTDIEAIEKAINSKTRFVYLETIGNPKMDIPDLARIAKIAHGCGIPLVVDNTLATPYLCRPFELGADVVIHSTTKYLSGHGDALGGVVIDNGKFDWHEERFPDFIPFVDRKGPLAFLDKMWREHHINFGATLAPMHSYLTMIGLDTLALRMERHMANAQEVATYLNERPEVTWVNYPGLENHPWHTTAQKQFGGRGFGGMMAFGLNDESACFRFIDSLQLIYNLANLGDCKTLVIHPASTQYVSFEDPTRESLSITADLIRLSVGIEAAEDICADLGQALDSL